MNRRTFVKNSTLAAASVSVFGSIYWNGRSFEGNNPTTTDILGPFYRPGSPMRSNIAPPNTAGEPFTVSGVIYESDGRKPMASALVEVWQCDEKGVYDNTSDDYLCRGAVKTGANGTYTFRTIVPVPYKVGSGHRPAHIHMRISSDDHQDLITQIYFKGDPHLDEDSSSSSPQAVNRILEIKNSGKGKFVNFNIVMSKQFPLEAAAYRKLTGLYSMNDETMYDFVSDGDLLFVKRDGLMVSALEYKGNNQFEESPGMKVQFSFAQNGETSIKVTSWDGKVLEGKKYIKYPD
jgi:protocatechuate 3,4-dioxygenase beta subunit